MLYISKEKYFYIFGLQFKNYFLENSGLVILSPITKNLTAKMEKDSKITCGFQREKGWWGENMKQNGRFMELHLKYSVV